ncbi:ABC transporter ATP-binding protein [Ectobacillus ponti]|uniref:ABC transporter ATP-binding protein n=1 Tax=Ectobacillus ponti TaxID=2961894 RepID=A0AA42BPW2_9BACI|nr:ABC transporter ATP-binding protein [Ectobacillus ponti]MCP8969625.1 ABC transporter ATP-binding protein [Ectobacillus ponti]
MDSAIVLGVQRVTKKMKQQTLVEDLSFQLRSGEIVGLLGPNGAGKTTTMKLIVGLLAPTEGDVRIKGHSITKNRSQALAHVGVMVEAPSFYPYFSGYDNLLYYARMMDGVEIERIEEVVELLGLTEAIHKKTGTYSLGMKQRLGIAQALLHRPQLLILDEPTNGLDPAGIREMRDYLKQIAKEEGTAILVSSHLLAEIELMCERVIIIQNGVCIEQYDLSAAPVYTAFAVSEAAAAARLLTEAGYTVRVKGDSLLAAVERQDVPAVVRLFAESGIDLYEIAPAKQNLEDMFLQATGGNVIV